MFVNDLVIRVKNRTHRGDILVTNDAVTQQIIDAINDARRDVIKLIPLKWLRATSTFPTVTSVNQTAATPLYDLPADCQEPEVLRYNFNGADYFLTRVASEREFYFNQFGTTVGPNKPLFYFDAGVNQSTRCRQIYIWPVADQAYTIYLTYLSDPTLVDLTVNDLNSQVPMFPNFVQDVLWKGAKYYFLQQFDDPAVQAAKAEYMESAKAMEVADDRDLDEDVAFRLDIGRRMTDFRSPGTGIRLK